MWPFLLFSSLSLLAYLFSPKWSEGAFTGAYLPKEKGATATLHVQADVRHIMAPTFE